MRHLQFLILLMSISLACARANAQATSLGENAPEIFAKGMNALRGSSATRSIPNAVEYFRRSAELGFAPAQVVLGYFYDTGRAITADPREALEWYKKAAQQDDPLAQWLVGRMIYAGLVPPRDLNAAQKWLEQSGEHGDPFADYLLGKIALDRSDFSRSEAATLVDLKVNFGWLLSKDCLRRSAPLHSCCVTDMERPRIIFKPMSGCS
jgi:hypothetical protein